jgi:hypothetical protein
MVSIPLQSRDARKRPAKGPQTPAKAASLNRRAILQKTKPSDRRDRSGIIP